MQPYFDYVMDCYLSLMNSTWIWFATLTREEWLVVLSAATAIGFICMKGFGSRSSY